MVTSPFYPSNATYECNGIDLLVGSKVVECAADGTWNFDRPRCLSPWDIIGFIFLGLLCAAIWICGYSCRVRSRHPPSVSLEMKIPEERLKRWPKMGLKILWEDTQFALLCMFCPWCRMADTWYLLGILPYYEGLGYAILSGPFLFVVGGYFRFFIRKRLKIKDS